MFQKGQSGNPKGRPKGAQDKLSAEVRQLAQNLLDATYWAFTRKRLLAGKLPPFIEAKLLAYAYGEPQSDSHAGGITVNIGFLAPSTPDPLPRLTVLTATRDLELDVPRDTTEALPDPDLLDP